MHSQASTSVTVHKLMHQFWSSPRICSCLIMFRRPCIQWQGIKVKSFSCIILVPLGGSPSVLIQKEDLTEAVKRGKKATFLALRLAEKVFGYEVMLGSTITGREGTERLDNDKLMAIRGKKQCADRAQNLRHEFPACCPFNPRILKPKTKNRVN